MRILGYLLMVCAMIFVAGALSGLADGITRNGLPITLARFASAMLIPGVLIVVGVAFTKKRAREA